MHRASFGTTANRAGEVKVGEKTRRPSQAAVKAVASVLSEGDFYTDADRCEHSYDPASDLAPPDRCRAWACGRNGSGSPSELIRHATDSTLAA